ncbi:hypothetical protein [Flavobacterium polysaccharolyticum]|uniref:Bacteriocin-type signal sequence-containing protein n=1 Tax=Flavobacterium polysaccharolyticum TaxID=3133148 RepID=A0ABU9NL84_9FLAO
MLKNILNLEGAQQLSKNDQKTINGGIRADQCIVTVFSQAECDEWMGKWTAPNRCLITKPVAGPGENFEFILC